MVSLLIDFDKIIKPNKLDLLESRISKPPETKFMIGLVLVINQKQYDSLQSLPRGHERVKYINSYEFVNSISGNSYIIYDEKRKICEIMKAEGSLLLKVIENTLFNIPNDVTLCVRIDLDSISRNKLIKEYTDAGFKDPYISKTSPIGFNFQNFGLCLFRENNIVNNEAKNDVKYILNQLPDKKNSLCSLKARLSDDAIKYLQQISRMGSTLNRNGIITQKEVAGRIVTGKITDDLTYHLEIDKSSIVYGEEEGVKIIGGLYNFHSHPAEAYDRNSVKFAWPSAQDYLGFMSSSVEYNTILHIVATLEGFYVISLHPESHEKKEMNKEMVSFILKKYELGYMKGKSQTPESYIKYVNNIKYEGYPIFLVQYINWSNPKSFFVVPYYRTGVNCFARQSTTDHINRLLKNEPQKLYI
jgi:hypothetical protein